MIMALSTTFTLTADQRAELQVQLRRRNLPASVAHRMRILLPLADGASYTEIQQKLNTAATTISRWKKRYEEAGLEGLATFHPGQPPRLLTAELRARILSKTKEAPPDGSTHWSLRKMAKVIKVGKDLVAKCGRSWVYGHIGSTATRPATIRSSSRPPTSSVFIYIHRSTRPYSALTRRAPSRPWTVRTAVCLCRRGAPGATDSNISDTGRCRSMLPFNTKTGNVIGKTARPPHQ